MARDQGYQEALDFMEKGNLPWHIDYGGASYKVGVYGDGVFKGTIDFGYRRGRYPGFHFSGSDTSRWLREHPGMEASFDKALLTFAKKHATEIERKIKDTLFGKDHYRIMVEAFGHGSHDIDEYKQFDRVKLDVKQGKRAKATKWERWVPLLVAFDAHAEREQETSDTPLSDLSDKHLDKVLYEVVGPEVLYMDGEIARSQIPKRMKMIRDQHRAMSPRQQQKIMKQFHDFGLRLARELAPRVAERHLHPEYGTTRVSDGRPMRYPSILIRLQPDYGESSANVPRGASVKKGHHLDRYPSIGVPRGWRPDSSDAEGCPDDYMQEVGKEYAKACETFMRRTLLPALKRRGWHGEGYDLSDVEHELDEEGAWAQFWVEGKAGQKISLGGRRYIVLDRNVSVDFEFYLAPYMEEQEFEGSQQFVDEFAEWTWDEECPTEEIEFLVPDRSNKRFKVNTKGLEMFLAEFDQKWIRETGVRSKVQKKASTNTECDFYKATDGKWYMDLESYDEDEDGEQIEGEMTSYGPFPSFKAAEKYLERNFANPGGYSEDDSGRARPPRNPVKPRRGRWAFNKYNPDELLTQLVDILDKYELNDAVREIKKVTPFVQRAWRARDREASASRVASMHLADEAGQEVTKLYLHLSNGGATYKVIDAGNGPELISEISSFSEMDARTRIHVDPEGLRRIADMLHIAAGHTRYSTHWGDGEGLHPDPDNLHTFNQDQMVRSMMASLEWWKARKEAEDAEIEAGGKILDDSSEPTAPQPPMKEAGADAEKRYKDNDKAVRGLLKDIGKLVAKHNREQEQTPLDWGYAGDLGHVKQLLEEVHRFLS